MALGTMDQAMTHLLAAGSDMGETIVVIAIIALSVLSNVANAWIKRAKEKKEKQSPPHRPVTPPRGRPRDTGPSAFPTARPRVPAQARTRPPTPTAKPLRPEPPHRPPTEQAPAHPPPTRTPRELLPELGDVIAEAMPELAEVLPEFLKPKKPAQAPPRREQRLPPHKATPSSAAKPRSEKKQPTGSSSSAQSVSKRLGALQSTFETQTPKESAVAAHVAAHIDSLKHPVPDADMSFGRQYKKKPSRAALRHAIIMSEILAKPRSLRPLEDLF